MSNLSTDDRVGWIQLRVAEKERRQRGGGGMTVRVQDMRYLLDRIVELEAQGKSLASLVLEQGRSMAHLGRERDYWKAAAEKAAEVSAE